ncbi:MAG: RsmG family class I SAM-dependent methyltransferase [Myxococcota bacterium]
MGDLASLCDTVGIDPPPGWDRYLDTVKAWGARTDLTAARNDRDLAEILFLDAAHLLRAGWVGSDTRWLDVGAGVGAPTIPLVLGVEDARCVLVEPRRRRVAFLRSAVGVLDLTERVDVRETKVDPNAPALDGSPFDIALSRATFDPATWLRVGLDLAQEVWVFTAGAALPEDTSGKAGPELTLARRIDYRVPSTDAPRSVLAFRRA